MSTGGGKSTPPPVPHTGALEDSTPPAGPPTIAAELAAMLAGGAGRASDIEKWALKQGWTRQQTDGGPPKFIDENGRVRVTIKKGSPRTPGSENPHVELRNAAGQRIDASGKPVTRNSPGNHTPIHWDLP